jgi:glycosyltransferase involved in cell wall biosynthesis
VGIDAARELQRRAIFEVPSELLRCAPLLEIIRTLAARMHLDPRLVDWIWEKEILEFDIGVAKNALDGVDAIYGYEFSALASFRKAKERGLACIYEVPSPEHDYVEEVIQQEFRQFPELNTGARHYFLDRQEGRTTRRRQEWALADVVIVNSSFTRETYAHAGLDISKVRVIPLGAPPVDEKGKMQNEASPLQILWVGTFSVRKGAHYLLSAWRRVAGKNIALEIFGANEMPARLTDNLPGTIKISSTVPRSILFERYKAADVLVFPTLCDGFGMVISEAFAHGLPVITTPRAGAVELVRHGENGLIVPPADSTALAEALEWCLTHRNGLQSMRGAALETARRWQWDDFRRALSANVLEGLRSAGHGV